MHSIQRQTNIPILAAATALVLVASSARAATTQEDISGAFTELMEPASRDHKHVVGLVIRPADDGSLDAELATFRAQLIQAAQNHPGVERVVTLDDADMIRGKADLQLAQDAGANGVGLVAVARVSLTAADGPDAHLVMYDSSGVELARAHRVLSAPAGGMPSAGTPQPSYDPQGVTAAAAPAPAPPPPPEPLDSGLSMGAKVDSVLFGASMLLAAPPLLVGLLVGTLGILNIAAYNRGISTGVEPDLDSIGIGLCLLATPFLCLGCIPACVGVTFFGGRRGMAARSSGPPPPQPGTVIIVNPGAQPAPGYVQQPQNDGWRQDSWQGGGGGGSAPAPATRSAPNPDRGRDSSPASHGSSHVGGPSSGSSASPSRGPTHVPAAPAPPPQRKEERRKEEPGEKLKPRRPGGR